MIIGTGIDLIDIRRIETLLEKHGARFKERYFTMAEVQLVEERAASGRDILTLAKRFAAKEACAKALGTGFIDGLKMQEIEVCLDKKGKPYLCLNGKAQDLAQNLTPKGMKTILHLSLTDEPPYAQAQVIIEAV
ncbi:MAG: holo-ACP synthase [Micavibrio sp.]|nr:holo-ACP synthase [Micavibrio sp.]|tara:strand:+ start:1114 stop:1515 length:402 start_codon:yes stop_codon:yes gene_type:complete